MAEIDAVPPSQPLPGRRGEASVADRLLAFRRLGDLGFSPDGSRLAFVVADAYREREMSARSSVWAGPLDGPVAPLTVGDATDAMPRWAPDGRSLAFVSDRRTPGRGGSVMRCGTVGPASEPEQLAVVDGAIEGMHWLSDTSLLLLVADPEAESASMDAAVRPELGSQDPLVIRPLLAWRRLLRLDVPTGHVTEVGPQGWTIWEFGASDRGHVVAVASPDPTENGWYHSSILWLDIGDRSARVVHASAAQIASPAVSADGSRVAFVEGWASDRGLVIAEVRVHDVASGAPVALVQPQADAGWVRWRDADSVWFAGLQRTETAYGWLDLSGAPGRLWTEPATIRSRYQSELAVSASGDRLAAVLDTPEAPAEVAWRPVEDQAWRRQTHLNADLAGLGAQRRIRRLTWRSVDGLEIDGLLVEPTTRPPGPRPLVVDIHGGPTYGHRFAFLPQDSSLVVDTGYPVLLVNYRGTPGRGSSFTRGNVGDPGGLELQDILTGIDACIRDGITDPARIAVMGVSYGGYLTAWALTQTTRFACGIVISGISDLLSCHRTCNNPAFYDLILETAPHGAEALARYADRSPIAHIGAARTPTLLLHGEKDLCTPVGQAQEYFQALVEQGVQAELVIYPREGHGLGNQELDHQRDALGRMREWLVRHLEPIGD